VLGPTLAVAPLDLPRALALAGAGAAAGVINGVAGGGTMVTFPTLLALGYPALTANVTSTVGIWPGYVGGLAGFRPEIVDQATHVRRLALPALAGAVAGSVLLLTTPSTAFRSLAPWLVLFAALLFAVQPLVARALARRQAHRARPAALAAGVFGASLYGGYFGAGLGVILLAVLGLTLPDTLARASGLRTALSVLVNGVAAAVFIARGPVVWGAAGIIAVCALGGGFAGAHVARRLPAPALRAVVVLIGLATFVALVR
jgi:uncharacterized membrane protein YfcA